MSRKIVLSGARPTGDLHYGNYFGAVANWVANQAEFDCFCFIADWHALTTDFDDTAGLRDKILGLIADLVALGMDPQRSALFLQSDLKMHAELYLLFGMMTPLPWLERCPTYKDKVDELRERDRNNYGFLGYPCLMAADILMYKADFVPVGEDQLPHLELTREIARRFNNLYGETFPEPQAQLTPVKVMPGTDGRKMSKSYGNTLAFADSLETIRKKVMNMVTDPSRIRKTDPGHPEICPVFAWHGILNKDEVAEIKADCRAGRIGCVDCKKRLAARVLAFHEPIHERRSQLIAKPDELRTILRSGAAKAGACAEETIRQVRKAMCLGAGDETGTTAGV